MQTILPSALKSELDSGNVPILLDVREEWEYNIAHIPGSVNISMSDTNKILKEFEPDQKIIVICHHGMRSFQVAAFLESEGFTQISNLEGGIEAWAETVDNTMERY